jgi:hypothetical protein
MFVAEQWDLPMEWKRKQNQRVQLDAESSIIASGIFSPALVSLSWKITFLIKTSLQNTEASKEQGNFVSPCNIRSSSLRASNLAVNFFKKSAKTRQIGKLLLDECDMTYTSSVINMSSTVPQEL